MPLAPITIDATLEPDGVTLHLERKVSIPAGRVTVTVQPPIPSGELTTLEILDRIHRDQQRRGRSPMTEEQMAAEIAELRADDDASEARWRQIWSHTRTPPGDTGTP